MPPKAGGAGHFALARLLLRLLVQLRQLDRKLLLLFATSLLPACIIPVGPEFQDPVGVPNSPPQILDPDPTWGAEVTAPLGGGYTFRITVTDVNGDNLFIRFLVDDFPVELNGVPRNGSPSLGTVENQITCVQISNQESRAKSLHKVLAAVADRMFDSDPHDLLKAIPPGLATPITWTLNMTCPVSPQ